LKAAGSFFNWQTLTRSAFSQNAGIARPQAARDIASSPQIKRQ
jgi:hypothetical protein